VNRSRFTVASLAYGASVSPTMIVAARSIQGLFGALLIPQGFTLLLRMFPREDLGRVFGLFGPLMAVSSISGPLPARLLRWLDPFGLGWRAVFLINVVIGVVPYPVSAQVLLRGSGDRSVRLDPAAALLLIFGLLGVLGGLIRSGDGSGGWPSAVAIAAGVVILCLFVRRQLRSPAPLLARSLFRAHSWDRCSSPPWPGCCTPRRCTRNSAAVISAVSAPTMRGSPPMQA